MADLFIKTGGDFSSATYQKVVSTGAYLINGSQSVSVNNATYTYAITPSEAGDVEGVVLAFGTFRPPYRATPTADYYYNGDVTVKLQENVASVWTDRASVTVNGTDINGTTYDIPTFHTLYYFEFTSPYTVTTTAGVWRLSISGTADNTPTGTTYAGVLLRSSSTVLGHALVISGTTSFTSGDNVWLNNGITMTIDQTQTFGSIFMAVDSVLQWENPPTSSYTFTAANIWIHSPGNQFIVGTSTDPIPVAQRAIIDVTTWTGITTASNVMPVASFSMYGAKPSGELRTVATSFNGSATSATLDASVASNWSIGDVIWFYGLTSISTNAVVAVTLTGVSDAVVSWSSGTGSTVVAGSAALNTSHAADCGIEMKKSFYTESGLLKLSGIHMSVNSTNIGVSGSATFPINDRQSVLFAPVLMESIFAVSAIQTTGIITMNYAGLTNPTSGSNMAGSIFKNNYFYAGNVASYLVTAVGSSLDVDNVVYCNGGFGAGNTIVTLYNATIDHTFFYTRGASVDALFISGSSIALNDVVIHYQYETTVTGFNISLTDVTINRAGNQGLVFGNGTYTLDNVRFGEKVANLVDMANPYTFYQVLSTGGSDFTFATGETSNAVLGSYIKIVDYDDVSGNDRTFWKYGKTQKVGDGLTDTTVHTSGTGKYAIRLQPTSSASNFEYSFSVPTGNIQNKTMTVFCWVKINSATYYAGTHQLPRLNINYDNGTTAYAQAAETTDWQLLYVAFTPTTAYGQITITMSGKTDATTTDAYFYVDDFGIAYPPNVSLDLGGLDNWANALPVTPPIALPLSAGTVSQGVWTVPTSALTGAGTIGKYLSKALTVAKFLGLK